MLDTIINALDSKNYKAAAESIKSSWKNFDDCVIGKEIYIFGTGKASDDFIKKYEKKYHIEAAFDNNENKWGEKYNGLLIKDPNELTLMDKSKIVVLITSTVYFNEISEQLTGLGIKNQFSFCYMECSKLSTKIIGLMILFYNKIRLIFYKIFSKNGLFKNYVWFHILAVLRVLHFSPVYKTYAGIEKMRNRHFGERCFIVATGPSLKLEDIETLWSYDEITFSMNSIFKIFSKTNWRPTYYAIHDLNACEIYKKQGYSLNFDDFCIKESFLCDTQNYIKLKSKNPKAKRTQIIAESQLNHLIPHKKLKFAFSPNMLWGHYSATTVTIFAINIAQYMGFKEIYLLGVDCNYSGSKQHFEDKNDNIVDKKTANMCEDDQTRGYKFIKKHMDKLGVKIYNATRGGSLEVFPRVDFDRLFDDSKSNEGRSRMKQEAGFE